MTTQPKTTWVQRLVQDPIYMQESAEKYSFAEIISTLKTINVNMGTPKHGVRRLSWQKRDMYIFPSTSADGFFAAFAEVQLYDQKPKPIHYNLTVDDVYAADWVKVIAP